MSRSINFWEVLPAVSINPVLDRLPIASEVSLLRADKGVMVDDWKAIVVNDEIVDIPTSAYKLVQHKEAFRPLIEGLTLSGVSNFKFNAWFDNKQARLGILTNDSLDGVSFGFKTTNSFDRSLAIHFGYSAKSYQKELVMVQKERVIVWGFRQRCQNGMVVAIPLESVRYTEPEVRLKVKSLVSDTLRIRHIGDVEGKLKQIKYITEALLLLQPSLDKMIKDAQAFKIEPEEIKSFLNRFVGLRNHSAWLENFYDEGGDNLWALFNSLTHYASHNPKMSVVQRERMLSRAGNLLTEVLVENA